MEKKANFIGLNGGVEQGIDTKYRYPLEEELQIIKSIQQGGKEREIAIEKLSNSYARLLTAIAKRYANHNLSIEELINAGNKGLVIAAEKFDISRGFKFICYAVWWVRQSIEKEIGKIKSQD